MSSMPRQRLRIQDRDVAAIILSLLSVAPICVTDTKAQEPSRALLGVSKVAVVVDLNVTGPPLGLSKSRLQTLVELRLRQGGIHVLSEEEDKNDPNVNPYVYVLVSALETKNRAGVSVGYAYTARLSARVFARVSLNQAIAPQELWVDENIAAAAKDEAAADVERMVGELTDAFLNAWLAANPRQ